MSFEIVTSETFVRQLKKLTKKYNSIARDLDELGASLADNRMQGKPLGKIVSKSG